MFAVLLDPRSRKKVIQLFTCLPSRQTLDLHEMPSDGGGAMAPFVARGDSWIMIRASRNKAADSCWRDGEEEGRQFCGGCLCWRSK
jgi:hypothetical protein